MSRVRQNLTEMINGYSDNCFNCQKTRDYQQAEIRCARTRSFIELYFDFHSTSKGKRKNVITRLVNHFKFFASNECIPL